MQFPVTANDEMHGYKMSACATFLMLALKKTRASGRNIGLQTLFDTLVIGELP